MQRGYWSITWRLWLTCWLVYALHASTNVARETYLALSLAEHASVRVDEYVGLHDDLFEIPGRGAYINNNPGASLVAAIPYAVARPALTLLYRLQPALLAPKPAAQYDDPRPNRNIFMNRARERGLDIKLGLAALVIQFLLMAPLGGAAAVLLFHALRHRVASARVALWAALLYAFGTPIFFRSAFLNQNVLIAHYVLAAWVCVCGLAPRPPHQSPSRRALLGAGGVLGLSVLTDYSGLPLLLVFSLWVLVRAWRREQTAGVRRDLSWFVLGGVPSVMALLWYQWAAFGHPLWPAQRYMPPTPYSVRGWNGLSLPSAELLLGNLFDPRYGLFIFCPLLLLSGATLWPRFRRGILGQGDWGWLVTAALALYVFSSANQFATLQWNTGVRYMVPAVPLLFVVALPVLLRASQWFRWTVVVLTVAISWAVSMTREDVPRALLQVFLTGFELPVLTALRKMASGYVPTLSGGVSPLPLFCLTGVVLWLVWRRAPLADRVGS